MWNGRCIFYEDKWVTSTDMHLYTHASNLAASAYFSGSWIVVPFIGTLTVVFQYQFMGSRKRIMLHCNNQCIVEVARSGTCWNPLIRDLVRKLFFIPATFSFEMSGSYSNIIWNECANSLSHFQFDQLMVCIWLTQLSGSEVWCTDVLNLCWVKLVCLHDHALM